MKIVGQAAKPICTCVNCDGQAAEQIICLYQATAANPMLGLPDYSVPFTVGDAGVVGEEDSVVGQHRVTGGQDAPRRLAHAVQDAVINQEVID